MADGTRQAVTVSGTRKAAYEELLDSLIALPARYRGPGVEDTTNTVSKTIRDSDALDELRRVAFLGGEAVIESQGRIKAVKVMRDEPMDYIVARYPIGSYEPRGMFGPGFSTRLDEYFVRYNWEETEERFDNERRFVNAVAFDKLGGAGLFSETRLDDETCKWINTQALADAVGDRIPKHFGNGQIILPIRTHDSYRNPALELGDVVLIETDLFVARSPINSEEIRGPVTAPAIIVGVDPWGQNLDLWVPGFEYIVASTGTVTRSFAFPAIPTGTVVDFDASGKVKVFVYGDRRTANLFVAVGDGTAPSDPTAATNDGTVSGSSGEIDTGVKISTGNEAYLKVVAANADGGLSGVAQIRQGRRIGPFHKDTTTRSHTGDTLETTLETITVPANVLGTDGELTLEIAMTTLNTNGTKTARVKFGGTTIASAPIGTGVQNLYLRIKISNDGSASSQRSMGFWMVDGANTQDVINTDTSIDTTSAADIVITGQLVNASDTIQLNTSIAKLGGTL